MLFFLLFHANLWAALAPKYAALKKISVLEKALPARQNANTVVKLRIKKVKEELRRKEDCESTYLITVHAKVERRMRSTQKMIKKGKKILIQYKEAHGTCPGPQRFLDITPKKGDLIEAYLNCYSNSKKCFKVFSYGAFMTERQFQETIKKTMRVAGVKESDILLPHGTNGCADVIRLEGPALLGKLTKAQEHCLWDKISKTKSMAKKFRYSRLLIRNAQNSNNKKKWKKYLSHHLKNISNTDPMMTFQYAIAMAKEKNYKEAVFWAEKTLENKSDFPTGKSFVFMVTKVYRLRGISAVKLWESNKKKSKNKQISVKATKEWLDYMTVSKQNSDEAMKYCLQVSPKSFC